MEFVLQLSIQPGGTISTEHWLLKAQETCGILFITKCLKGTHGQIPPYFLLAPLNTDAGLFELDHR